MIEEVECMRGFMGKDMTSRGSWVHTLKRVLGRHHAEANAVQINGDGMKRILK